MTRKIVAIGGGAIYKLETLSIDTEIVHLAGKRKPRVLFIPTATVDNVEYWEAFRRVYGKRLGCLTDVLFLYRENPLANEIRKKILTADIIYVGGGNTLKMMNRWRRMGVDKLLRRAYQKGIVLSGLSAGAICWFKYGTSDWRKFYDPDDDTLIRVAGLGLVNLIISPHHIREPHRKPSLINIMKRTPGMGIALDDFCALEIVDDRYRIITSRRRAKAFRVYHKDGKVFYEPIEKTRDFKALGDLLTLPLPTI